MIKYFLFRHISVDLNSIYSPKTLRSDQPEAERRSIRLDHAYGDIFYSHLAGTLTKHPVELPTDEEQDEQLHAADERLERRSETHMMRVPESLKMRFPLPLE